MRRRIKAVLPAPVWRILDHAYHRWFYTYKQEAYSQEGEDLILARFLDYRQTGFYVDVGAHHPRRFSNTQRLYRLGWRGLNIDAAPGSMSEFRRLRPRDVNVEAAVATANQELTFYLFNDPALNTFERDLALQRADGKYKIIRELNLATVPLWQVLDRYVPGGVSIDVLSIDVEGLDYDVLRSNDWARYRPEFVLAEIEALTVEDAITHRVSVLLADQGYAFVAKTKNTVIFKRMQGHHDHPVPSAPVVLAS
jgi:FkbM family methyltransferase